MSGANSANQSASDGGNGKADFVFAIVIIAFSALVYWQTLGLPPPRYEPMGSAAVPQALSVIMASLAAVVFIRAGMRWRRARQVLVEQKPAQVHFIRRPWLAVWTFVVTIIYVAAMDQKLIGYLFATPLYVCVTGMLLTRGDWQQLRWIACFAVGLSVICYFLFTRVFFIDLP